MELFLATKTGTPIIGQIASVMGWIMDGIYKMLDGLFGIQNIGLCIIIFSILIFAFMTPLQIKQQKFSKMSAVMNPEIQKIQKKYQGKKDQDSMMKMNEETQAVYQKYGVSPTGSCVQLAIQMPILFALYQVIYRIPAYVGSVKSIFTGVVDKLVAVNGYTDILQQFITDNSMTRVRLVMDSAGNATSNSIVDFLYALSPEQWKELAKMDQFSGFSDMITSTSHEISKMQGFCGLNIADQPLYYIMEFFKNNGSLLLAIIALLIPVLAWATQMLNLKLMPQAATQPTDGNDQASAMANSMKTMNMVMPLMSAWFCFTLPSGLGLYWVAGSVVRSIQQIVINKHIDKMNFDDIIKKNSAKSAKKLEKMKEQQEKLNAYASMNTKNIQKKANISSKIDNSEVSADSYSEVKEAKPGSMMSKANMVRDYNEKNSRK